MIKKLKIASVVMFSLVLGILDFTYVNAAEAFSSYSYYTVNSYSYKARASINTDGSKAWSYTDLYTSDSSDAPSGYMGAQARVYNDAGTLKKSSDYVYTSSATDYISVGTTYTVTGGTYYGMGNVKLYNGSSYSTYQTTKSPSQSNTASSAKSSAINIKEYNINESGQTYGSGMYSEEIGSEPDLMKAVGENNTTGYVYSEDLEGTTPESPEEVEVYMEQLEGSRSIPLYASDGETVIGSFEITTVIRNVEQ